MEVAIVIFIIGISISVYCFYLDKKEKQRKKEEKEKQRRREEDLRQLKRDRETVINFAKNNGFKDIEKMLKERDDKITQALRNYAFSIVSTPVKPSYSKGVKSGSLADNVAYIANTQKKAEYDKQISYYNETIAKSNTSKNIAGIIESNIIKKLEKIPDSKKYVMLLQNYFDDSNKVFNNKN